MKTLWRTSLVVGTVLLTVSLGYSQMRMGKLGVGISGTGYVLNSDFKSAELSGGGGVNVTYSMAENVSLRSLFGLGVIRGKNSANVEHETQLSHWNISVNYDFIPHQQFNPFIFAGTGLLFFDPRTSSGDALTGSGASRFDINFLGGAGFDYFFNEFWALTVSGEAVLGFTDQLDGIKSGSNDLYGRISIGIRYHFFDEEFVRRMVDTFEKRGK